MAARVPRRGRCALEAVNGVAVSRARRRWRRALTALAALAALGLLARAVGALAAGDAAAADARGAVLCAFVAGLLGGRLIEGLRRAPRPPRRCSWTRRRRRT